MARIESVTTSLSLCRDGVRPGETLYCVKPGTQRCSAAGRRANCPPSRLVQVSSSR